MLYPHVFRKTLLYLTLPLVFASISCLPAFAQIIAPANSAINNPETKTESNAETASPSYVLGAGDQIEIAVYDYSEFTGSKVILSDGTIALPLIGNLTAAGRTTRQLAQDLTVRLQPLLVNPVVSISLATPRPVLVNVAGEVQRPGPVQLGNLAEGKTTLSAALAGAGGITKDADIRKVELRRYSPDNSTPPITINLWDAIQSDNASPDLILQAGDSIYVPHLVAGDALDRRLMTRSSFAPATVRVRVVGEVTKPGEIEVPPDSSISSAVAIAGGPTQDARLSKVAFIRMNDSGQIERQTLDLRNLTDNYQVQDGDVIIVPKQTTSSVLDYAARIFTPLGLFINLFK